MGVAKGALGPWSILCRQQFCQLCKKVIPRLSEHGDVIIEHLPHKQTMNILGSSRSRSQHPGLCRNQSKFLRGLISIISETCFLTSVVIYHKSVTLGGKWEYRAFHLSPPMMVSKLSPTTVVFNL